MEILPVFQACHPTSLGAVLEWSVDLIHDLLLTVSDSPNSIHKPAPEKEQNKYFEQNFYYTTNDIYISNTVKVGYK